MTVGKSKHVCLICLKRFDAGGDWQEDYGYQTRVLSATNPIFPKTKENGLPPVSEEDLYSRFLHFSHRYFRLISTSERFLLDARDLRNESKEEVRAFCESCHDLVHYVCDLYSELNVIKLHLIWKLGRLGELIGNSKKCISGKLGASQMKVLMTQLNIKAVRQLNGFRKQLALKCKLKDKASTPRVMVHRGLFPEEWKFTYEATKKMLTVLIVIFALASSSVYSRKEAAEAGGRVWKKDKKRKIGSKKNASFADISTSVVKKENNQKQDDITDDNFAGNDDDGFPDAPRDNDSDSDWSCGAAAASPCSIGSPGGSDVDFNPKEETNSSGPRKRWNLRRSRRRRAPASDNENRAESEMDEDNNDADFLSKPKRARNSKPKKDYTKDPIPCKKCNKLFIDTRGLSKHMLVLHGLRIDYACPHCGMKFKRQADMYLHKRNAHKHLKHQYSISGSSSTRRVGVKGRLPQETKCNACEEIFPTKTKMLLHRREVHKTMSTNECPICFKKVLSAQRFKIHLQTHDRTETEGRNIQFVYCEVCGKHFFRETKLSEHMSKKHGSLYPCSVCDTKFSCPKTLRFHLETHETDQKFYYCTFCYRGFTNDQYFKVHSKIAHSSTSRIFCDQEKCAEEFQNVQELNEHLKTHIVDVTQKREPTRDGDEEVGTTPSLFLNNPFDDELDGRKIFECGQCGLGFLKKYNLTLHELVHTPKNVETRGYDCPKCPKTVRYIEKLLIHFNNFHGAKFMPFRCPECKQLFASPGWFRTHMRMHKDRTSGKTFLCDICGAECIDSVCLSAHRRGHDPKKQGRNSGVLKITEGTPEDYLNRMDPGSPPDGSSFKRRKLRPGRPSSKQMAEEELRAQGEMEADVPCELCNEKFISGYLLRKHYEDNHETEEKTIPCCFCFHKFTFEQTYNLHLRAKHKAKFNKFPCDDPKCEHLFTSHTELTEHLKTCHLKEISSSPEEKKEDGNIKQAEAEPLDIFDDAAKSYTQIHTCTTCDWGFLNKDCMELHALVHLDLHADGYYACPRCTSMFASIPHVVNHFNKMHGSNLKPYKCKECYKDFFNKRALQVHFRLHERRRRVPADRAYVCIDCGKKCLDARMLAAHRKQHNPNNHLDCPECGKTFQERNKLNIHLKAKHDIGAKYPCPVCGKLFIYAHYIRQHMHVHKEASHQCNECGKFFKRIYALRKHQRQHDPDRAAGYICSECGMAYKSEEGLKYHIKSIHTADAEKKFSCPYCPKRSHRKVLMDMHIKTCMRNQGIRGENGDEEVGSAPQPKPKVRRQRRPRKKKAEVRKQEEEEEEEMDSSSTTSEDEALVQDNTEEKPSVPFPRNIEEELKPTSMGALDAIIANLIGNQDHIPTEGRSRGIASTNRRSSTAPEQDVKALTSNATSSASSSFSSSTVDHALLHNTIQPPLQNLPAPPGFPAHPYQHWLSTTSAVTGRPPQFPPHEYWPGQRPS